MQPREERILKRIPCSIELDGERQKAIVLNLSRAGLFVQTRATPGRGAKIAIALDSGNGNPLELPTTVVWKRRSATHTSEIGGRGLGLRLSSVPQRYVDLCDELLPVVRRLPRASSAAKQPDSGRPYRVRLRLAGSARTRRLDVEAGSEASAAAAALERAVEDSPGQLWEVLEVSSLAIGKSGYRVYPKR